MQYGNEIIITPVANGWVVTIPLQMDVTLNPNFQAMIAAGQIIKGKDILDEIQEKQKEPEAQAKISRQENIFVFKTFDAVLKFLEQYK